MEFQKKLPRNGREFIIFLGVVSITSVCIIAPLITCFEMGFNINVLKAALTSVPLILVVVIVLVLLIHPVADKMTYKIITKEDSFHASIIVNTMCTVLCMSIILTVVATWIGTKTISMEPIQHFFYKWPRNFAIALAVELLIAQPLGHVVMSAIHKPTSSKLQ